MDGIYTDKFVGELLDIVNDRHNEWLKDYYFYYGDGEYDDDYQTKYNINNFIIYSFEVIIPLDVFKKLHKQKFYKDLYDELMEVAWDPDRFMDWCLDFEESRNLKERWGKKNEL